MKLSFGSRLRAPAVKTDADGTHPRCEFGLTALGLEAPVVPDADADPAAKAKKRTRKLAPK